MEQKHFESEPDIVIREFRSEDIEPYIDMHRRSWLDTYPNDEIGLTREGLESMTEDQWKEVSNGELEEIFDEIEKQINS